MILFGDLNNIINCCFGGCPQPTMSFYDLFIFSVISFFLIVLLGFYYDKIPKNTKKIDNLTKPIFNSKNILLQEITYKNNYFSTTKSISTTRRVILFLLIVAIATIPLYELLGLSIFY